MGTARWLERREYRSVTGWSKTGPAVGTKHDTNPTLRPHGLISHAWRWGAGVISALVMFSAFGALNGIVMMGPRVYYQIAQDGLMFGWFSHLHPTFQTPDRAIILQAIWSSVGKRSRSAAGRALGKVSVRLD